MIKKKFSLVALAATLILTIMTLLPALATDEGSDDFRRYWPDNLFAVEFVSDNVGYIAGYSGTVLRTTDGGENWDFHYIGRNELIRRTSFVDESTGWAVGHRGSIFHTDDAGESWKVQLELSGIYLRDVDFADRLNGWVVGHDANIWHTANGGQSWQQQKLLGFNGRDVPRLHGIYAKDASTGILVGEFGVLGHTENGGELWLTTPTQEKITWLSVDGDADSIYAVGLEGTIVQIAIASAAERAEIDQRVLEEAAIQEARARKKAERRNREYVKQVVETLPIGEIEYVMTKLESNTTEHLFDISMASDNSALVVGRSSILRVSDSKVVPLTAKEGFPLPYVWFGGVSVTPSGTVWTAGIRGLVASGELSEMSFDQALSLGSADQNQVKLKSSRWGDDE